MRDNDCSAQQVDSGLREENQSLRDEIDDLRSEIECLEERVWQAEDEAHENDAYIDRLREEMDRFKGDLQTIISLCGVHPLDLDEDASKRSGAESKIEQVFGKIVLRVIREVF